MATPAILNPVSNAGDFTIYHRDRYGKPDKALDPGDNITTCVVKSINIFRGMLYKRVVQNAFLKLAENVSREQPNAWFVANPALHTSNFLDILEKKFPYVFVDDSMRNPRTLGAHWRHSFDKDFEMLDQCILLDGRVCGPEATIHVVGARAG